MSQNPSLQQNAQFYPPQQQFFYQQTEQRYAQLPMHPNQGAIYMQPMAAPAIGPPHQQMHSIHQDYQQHQSTHPGPNYAPHPHPPQQLLTSMAAHGGQQIANLVPFNMMGMDGPPPMVSAPAHQQQPQHFHSHQQQPHLPPQSAPYHNQSSNFVPASKPKVNPSIPFYGGNHVDMKGNGPHQQMHPFHQDYQQHQSTYPGANFLPHAHPPPSLLAPHGGQQMAGVVSQFGMMSMNMDTPPPMVPAPAHQQHIYAHQQQHHMPPQSAPPSHTPFIPTSKSKGRSMSIQPPADGLQPAESTGAEEGGGGNNIDGKEGNEALENGRNDGGGQQTPVDGRNSSTTDAQQTKTTPSSMETKEENKHRTLSGEGDKNKPIKMDQWQPSKDQPAASISPNNTVGGGHGNGTPPDSGSAMVTMTTNSAAINVPGRPPSSHQYQQQPNSQLQSRRTSQDNRQEGRGQEGGRTYNNSTFYPSGRADQGKYNQNRPSGHGPYGYNNYKSNTGGGGGPPNMFSGNNPSNPSSHHQQQHQQYLHNYQQNNQSSFYGARSQDVRTNQCPACNNSGHRLMQCPENKVEREQLHKFARQFEKEAHHPALQEPKEMTSSNRAPYHQRHSQEGGRGGGGGDYHHHHYNPQQQNNQHKRFGSGGGGGGGGNRYSNNNAFGGGRDGGGGIRASKGGGGGNYRPNAQQQQQQ